MLYAGNAANDAQGAAEAAGKAVSAVSGDQILKAIVDAAETTGGRGAHTATNAVEAAIGDDVMCCCSVCLVVCRIRMIRLRLLLF